MKRVVILLQQQNNNKKKDNYSINNMNNEQNHYLLCRIAELWLKLDKKKQSKVACLFSLAKWMIEDFKYLLSNNSFP